MDKMEQFWDEQAEWSRSVFGSDQIRGPQGPLKHLAKEVQEVLADPTDLEEYADLMFLVVDATRRADFTYQQLMDACFAKLVKNKSRKWGPASLDEPVEHVRVED